MVRAALFALVIGSAGSSAVALPALAPDHSISRPDPVVEVKIVCTEDGQCNRPPRRKWGALGSLEPALNSVGLERMKACQDVSVGIPAGQPQHVAGLSRNKRK